jgi:ribosome assembly protein YihI (activator of Der GTPase)
VTDLLRVWDRQPSDTPRSWQAFTEYISMPIYGEGDEKRSIKNVAKRLGHKSEKQCEEWSAKFNWVERAAAFDAYNGSKAISLREVSLDQVKSAHITRVTTQAAVISSIVEKRLKRVLDALERGEDVDTMDIKRLTDTVDNIDIIMRRATGMPTTYTGAVGEEPDYEQQVYTIGGEG